MVVGEVDADPRGEMLPYLHIRVRFRVRLRDIRFVIGYLLLCGGLAASSAAFAEAYDSRQMKLFFEESSD